MLSKYSRDPLASHMYTPLSDSSLAFVEPLMNHSNSSTTPRQNTLLVVNNGKQSTRKQTYTLSLYNF